MRLHEFLDTGYGKRGDHKLRALLHGGADPNASHGPFAETALHVASRRRRLSAVKILLQFGADIDAVTAGGKTAYIHAARRGFGDICAFFEAMGARQEATDGDRLAIAVTQDRKEQADAILASNPRAARTGNPEEDRLLADVAGRNPAWPVAYLIRAGADLSAPGLDDGTPLHQAAWFGQPANAQLLLEARAPLDIFDGMHQSSPLGWAVHGSRYSGGAKARQRAYVAVVDKLLAAGSSLSYPHDEGLAYYDRLVKTASRRVRARLRQARKRANS